MAVLSTPMPFGPDHAHAVVGNHARWPTPAAARRALPSALTSPKPALRRSPTPLTRWAAHWGDDRRHHGGGHHDDRAGRRSPSMVGHLRAYAGRPPDRAPPPGSPRTPAPANPPVERMCEDRLAHRRRASSSRRSPPRSPGRGSARSSVPRPTARGHPSPARVSAVWAMGNSTWMTPSSKRRVTFHAPRRGKTRSMRLLSGQHAGR